jgi:hypothetical protein
MTGIRAWGLVTMIGLLAGCHGGRCPLAPRPKATVSHVVLCWLKEPGNEAQRQKLIETSKTFRDIPGVVSVESGVAVPSSRPVVDSSFDVGVIMRFEDQRALDTYEAHPTHQKAVNEVLRPLAGKIVVYDVIDR